MSGGQDYAGKPRPAVILQDDSFDATNSITICAFTTDETDAPLFRLPIQPNAGNGLNAPCRLMVDKITTVSKAKIGARVGRLDDEDIVRLNQAVLVWGWRCPRGRKRKLHHSEQTRRRGCKGAGRLRTRVSPVATSERKKIGLAAEMGPA